MHGCLYYKNDYYVVPNYKILLDKKINFEKDREAIKSIKNGFATTIYDLQGTFPFMLKEDYFKGLLTGGLLDSVEIEYLDDDWWALSEIEHTPEVRENLVLLLDYLVERGTDVYSHILDDDRRINAQLFEEEFYSNRNFEGTSSSEDSSQETEKQPADLAALAKLLTNPETADLLKQLVSAMGK